MCLLIWQPFLSLLRNGFFSSLFRTIATSQTNLPIRRHSLILENPLQLEEQEETCTSESEGNGKAKEDQRGSREASEEDESEEDESEENEKERDDRYLEWIKKKQQELWPNTNMTESEM